MYFTDKVSKHVYVFHANFSKLIFQKRPKIVGENELKSEKYWQTFCRNELEEETCWHLT